MNTDDLQNLIAPYTLQEVRSCEACEHDVGCWFVRVIMTDGEDLRVAYSSQAEAEQACAFVLSLLGK